MADLLFEVIHFAQLRGVLVVGTLFLSWLALQLHTSIFQILALLHERPILHLDGSALLPFLLVLRLAFLQQFVHSLQLSSYLHHIVACTHTYASIFQHLPVDDLKPFKFLDLVGHISSELFLQVTHLFQKFVLFGDFCEDSVSHCLKICLKELIFELVAVLTLGFVIPVSVLVLFLSLVSKGLVDVSSSAGFACFLRSKLKLKNDGLLPSADIDLLQQFAMHLCQFFLQELYLFIAMAVIAGLEGVGIIGVVHSQLIL